MQSRENYAAQSDVIIVVWVIKRAYAPCLMKNA